MSAGPAATRDAYPAILAATEPEPRTRIRISHSRTIKEGWGYETTVEVEWDGQTGTADSDACERLEELLTHARLLGQNERDVRNRLDGRP